MAVHCAALVLACVAFACHGRRMHRLADKRPVVSSQPVANERESSDAGRPLRSLLLAAVPPRVGQVSMQRSGTARHARLLRHPLSSEVDTASKEVFVDEAEEDVLDDVACGLEFDDQELQLAPIFSSRAAASMVSSSRVQRIKNICANKEIQNVLASCDFALRLEVTESPTKVDFAALIARVGRSINLLRLRNPEKMTAHDETLVRRLLDIKKDLEEALADLERQSSESIGSSVNSTESTGEPTSVQDVNKSFPRLNFKVREDGSVDLDEALASGREVARFGAELWERLNGKEDELPSIAEFFSIAKVKTKNETEEIRRLSDDLSAKEAALDKLLEEDAAMKEDLRKAKSNGCAITYGDSVKLRRSKDKAMELRNLITLCELNLDMERLCAYLEQDLEDSGQDIAELKLAVAEVGFLERQLLGVMGCLLEDVVKEDSLEPNLLLSLVDEYELELIRSKVNDLKTRLGIEGSPPPEIDWGTVGELLLALGNKVKEGATFYGDGTKILLSDLQYVFKLTIKATGGYTLKPREVNTVRRTIKDVLTLVPFTIILLIPLSPIGHVLVFSFIQRFLPEFFPSCYTEKRLNLRQLYLDVLKSEEELLGPPPRKPLFSSFRSPVKGKR